MIQTVALAIRDNAVEWRYHLLSTVSFVLVLLPVVTYYTTLALFKATVHRGAGRPPVVPYLVPLIGHTHTFALGDTTLASSLLASAKHDTPVRFKGIGFDFVLLSGTHLIRQALLSSHHLDWNKLSASMFGLLFGAPKEVCDATLADNSGTGAKPYPGTSVHPGRRLIRNQVIFFNDAFSKPSMDELMPRFQQNLEGRCVALDIGDEWREMPDLYAFLRGAIFSSAVKSFYGDNMFKLNPNLEHDFKIYDDNVPFLSTGMPSWIKPQATRYRAKCLAAVKRWRQEAIRQSEHNAIHDSVEWDPVWGLGAIRRRNKLFDATEGLFDEDATAASDLATMWAFTANVIPATFWFLFEILVTEGLLARARSELQGVLTDTGSFDAAKVVNSALLQSIYAEVLRLHVASLITRTVKHTHNLDNWVLPNDQYVMVSSHVEHRDSFWNGIDTFNNHRSPSEFWAERFLVDDEGTTKFSLEGKHGRWIPYGMGEHMCPGRHFAKYEMILSFSVLISAFDIELLDAAGKRPDDNLARYGFGAQPPKQKVKFRIRRRGNRITS